ncbi:MAG: very short patch repair endonuclease [Desulfobacter sp.]
MDKITPEQRSKNMAAVKNKNTTPEVRVRKALHSMGYRFRLHRNDLPGCPDIVLPKYKWCIFVHGCFWHQHPGCKRATFPETRKEFWELKFKKNKERDELAVDSLKKLGWKPIVIWECETKKIDKLVKVLSERLSFDEL